MIEVEAKRALGHRLLQVPVRRGDNANIDGYGRMPADAGDFALLKHAQQPHLRGE